MVLATEFSAHMMVLAEFSSAGRVEQPRVRAMPGGGDPRCSPPESSENNVAPLIPPVPVCPRLACPTPPGLRSPRGSGRAGERSRFDHPPARRCATHAL